MTLPQRFENYRSPRALPTLLLPMVQALYEDAMADRDVVVLGGSAGAIDGLITIVGALPADFAAAILVVVHVPATAESRLPEILARNSALDARHARHGDELVAGRILVAPPDHHLTIERGRVRLGRGPRENRHRPALDPLLRSAARWHDGRTIAVVLSGGAGDGIAGCLAVKERGGMVVVQDPDDALFDGMPRSVAGRMDVDASLPVAAIGPELARLVGSAAHGSVGTRPGRAPGGPDQPHQGAPVSIHRQGLERAEGPQTAFGCPDCGGVLQPVDEGSVSRFRCLVGHAYSPEALLDAQTDALESALWMAVRGLEERSELLGRLADRSVRVSPESAERYRTRAGEASGHAAVIRRFLLSPAVIGPAVPALSDEEAVGSR
jgi:two-component system chemotaxis response regulator CheB